MPITTFGIGAAVTPTVVKTTFSHYTNRKPRANKPTAHISYDQGIHLIRSFLDYASHHTVEDVQAFTAQWVPHPTWIRIEDALIPQESISKAADLITAQLGEKGIEAIGGRKWWQWRKRDSELKAEWIEMRADYNQRQRGNKKCRRVMLYAHGGAYFFGSVDEHRYQLQRHARKLQARVFAPRYRLAPQFPFPCGLLDCLAAYLYLLTLHDPSEIVFAADSAGGGMVLSMLCILRDQGIVLPAGAILISPWVDLTHSFPSLDREDKFDYIPAHGFMQKPSRAWPPPNEDELLEITRAATAKSMRPGADGAGNNKPDRVQTPEPANFVRKTQPPISLQLDGKEIVVKDQIQMYTTNQLITHPLVSPILQPSLGGLPPLLIMVGGGERLRDEQIYLAHKAADPIRYKLNERWRALHDSEDTILRKYKPTPVQIQVWEDLCHVTPTLSFTRPAKFMYRSIAQFGAWALSRAQKRAVEIEDDDDSSIESSSDEDSPENGKATTHGLQPKVGKAGDPLPSFKNSMIREQVDRHGNVYPLPQASELPAMQMASELVGIVKEGPIRKWLAAKQEWDTKYASTRRKVQWQRIEAYKRGNTISFGNGEFPPPSALAGRTEDIDAAKTPKQNKSWGLGMWSSWGWEYDKKTVRRDKDFDKHEQKEEKKRRKSESKQPTERPVIDKELLSPTMPAGDQTRARPSSRRKTVSARDEGQLDGEDTQAAVLPMPSPAPALILSVDPPTPEDEQPLTPMFIPKWKAAAHLGGDAKDISDVGSTYSRRTIDDNASTMAVFSAPGVQRHDSETADAENDNLSMYEARDTPTLTVRPETPAPRIMKDNLGGYDTPNSRRSLERLQRHQTDGDGQSIQSTIPASTIDDVESSDDISSGNNGRLMPLRSPSSMAIVQAEGVIAPVEEIGRPVTPVDTLPNCGKAENVNSVIDTTKASQPEHEMRTETANRTDTTTMRPRLYDREASEFATAMEKA